MICEGDRWWAAVLKHALHNNLTRSVTISRGVNVADLPALG